MPSTTERGRRGEDLAAQALTTYGCDIVDRNWRCAVGEIDLVAREEDAWVFVEVKTRQSKTHGTPEEAVDAAKQGRLLQAAVAYISEHELDDVDWRIDVIAITLASDGRVQRLTRYCDAVRDDG